MTYNKIKEPFHFSANLFYIEETALNVFVYLCLSSDFLLWDIPLTCIFLLQFALCFCIELGWNRRQLKPSIGIPRNDNYQIHNQDWCSNEGTENGDEMLSPSQYNGMITYLKRMGKQRNHETDNVPLIRNKITGNTRKSLYSN
jgi:hypothetical protein